MQISMLSCSIIACRDSGSCNIYPQLAVANGGKISTASSAPLHVGLPHHSQGSHNLCWHCIHLLALNRAATHHNWLFILTSLKWVGRLQPQLCTVLATFTWLQAVAGHQPSLNAVAPQLDQWPVTICSQAQGKLISSSKRKTLTLTTPLLMWQDSRSSATVGKVKSHFPFQQECVLLQYFWVTTILQAHLPKERHRSSSKIYFACLLVDISHKNSLWLEKCTYLSLLF